MIVADEKNEKTVVKVGEEPRRRVFRVSGVKVALRHSEIRKGPRGRFVRRLGEILGRIRDASDEPFCGVEAYEPPRRPIVPSPVDHRPVAGKGNLGGSGKTDKKDDSDDED